MTQRLDWLYMELATESDVTIIFYRGSAAVSRWLRHETSNGSKDPAPPVESCIFFSMYFFFSFLFSVLYEAWLMPRK